ncbi:serine hydrolase domain-containing protein [Vannielia litorea]|uniref:serine hydrolase domain-containing protein n=1 Tax=Vannielia litorea TaxID=1217970 RepID=UPI001C952EFC|nr:serine hydrolase [Vannielia litorea]MBY6047583.1 beta-lactamase family protein [Vannielia litorea]MBY6074997.1 beta-lactamase family protein [Vannielia litorea]
MITRRTMLAAPALLLVARPLMAQSVEEKARSYEQLRCLIVQRGGERVVEEVVAGPAVTRPVNVKSVSKTLVAALLGCAVDRGELSGVAATLGEVTPGLIPSGADSGVAGITMEDLVTLRAGLERTSGANYGAWVSSSNWVANALGREMVAAPGGRMLYSTGTTHVLGAVLAEVGDASLLTLMRDRLGVVLGEIPAWTRDPQGRYLGGNEMAVSPDGLTRFGEMVRAGGLWQGERLLSEEWIEASFVPRTRSPWSGLGYGYGWFIGESGGMSYALARGYGGQVLAVCPEAEVVVTITSDPTQPARSGGYFGQLQALVEQVIAEA